MIRFGTKPSTSTIKPYIRHCQNLDFNYPYVGQTRDLIDEGDAPRGFRLDRFLYPVGHGQKVFNAVTKAISQWEMFNHPMSELNYLNPEIKSGNTVVVVFGMMGLWTVNPARIIYEIEDYTLNPRSRAADFQDLKFDAIPILRKLKDARKYAQQSKAHYGTIKKTR